MPDKPMRLVALMLVRNEDWVIRASLDAALRWCDGVVVVLDRCTDLTAKYVHDHLVGQRKPCLVHLNTTGSQWDEMQLRQTSLELGRKLGGTHFAIVDADEVLTHNMLGDIRRHFEGLKEAQLLEVPMVPVWDSLERYRVGDPTWSTSWLTLGFKDAPHLAWCQAADGYQHHNRPPRGHQQARVRIGVHGLGGVMHLQFANTRRLLAKHVLYRMVDHLRWPGRESVEQLNWKYDQALKPCGELAAVPESWWGDYYVDVIDLEGAPYQEVMVSELIDKHGRERFSGLDLKGF